MRKCGGSPTFMSSELNNRVVLVTGSARRIGRAIALELAARGAQVAIHYNRSEEDARRTAREINARLFQADLRKVSEIRRLFERVESAYGRLDGLVNNAAVYLPKPVLEVTEEDWDRIHATNLKAVFFCSQAAAKLMKKGGGGRIVNISSLGGLRPWTRHVPYGAAKAGVIMITRSMAKALAPEIQVNSVAPGVIRFDAEVPPEIRRLIEVTPMKRPGKGSDVAEAAAFFLTCPSFITGQVLAVDGGLSQRA